MDTGADRTYEGADLALQAQRLRARDTGADMTGEM
jgi:hypothetical protein